MQYPATSSDPSDGLGARLTKDPLVLEAAVPLAGSPGQDDLSDIALTPEGHLWSSGTANFNVDTRAWVLKSTTDGVVCGWQPMDPAGGLARGMDYSAGSIFITGSTSGICP